MKFRAFHVIYKTTCTETGRFYIGMHSTDNLDDRYLGSGLLLGHSIKKHGREKHTREILEFCSSRKDLALREKFFVNETLIANPLCMNRALGGEGGAVVEITEERKARVSAKMKGIKRGPISAETKAKLSASKKGKRLSEEHKEKMSATLKGKVFNAEYRAKISESRKGCVITEEQKRKISETKKGTVTSEETKLKLSQALLGKPKSEAHKAAISKGKKKCSHT